MLKRGWKGEFRKSNKKELLYMYVCCLGSQISSMIIDDKKELREIKKVGKWLEKRLMRLGHIFEELCFLDNKKLKRKYIYLKEYKKEKVEVYISTSLENMKMASDLSDLLEKENIDITYKWWNDSSDDKKDLEKLAKYDMQGVMNADYIICLRPNTIKKTGTIYELGAADALGKPVFLYGNNITGVFSCRINHRTKNIELSHILNDFLNLIEK